MRSLRSDGERAVSAHLFGQRHKMELLSALADAPDGRVNLTKVADDHGVKASVYYPPVKDLIAVHLVAPVPAVPKDPRRWYERRGGEEIWTGVGRFLGELRRLTTGS